MAIESKAKKYIGDIRNVLAAEFLRGNGIEIGALHYPVELPKGAEVTYVDRISREESIACFPELDSTKIVDPGVIDDGFLLASIAERSLDFLIANHVLEHSPNPLQALQRWGELLNDKGILFVSVPLAHMCFDKGRPITTLQHMIEDQQLYCVKDDAEIAERNLNHYIEWVTISAPNISKPVWWRWTIGKLRRQSTINKLACERLEKEQEIHFHTFTKESYIELLNHFASKAKREIIVEQVEPFGIEVIAILRVGKLREVG